MTDLHMNGVHSRTITAFFDTRQAAQKATDDLVAVGIPKEHIRITEGAVSGTGTDRVEATEDRGFWDDLKDLFLPDEDRHGYAEGLRRGGYLLSVRAEEAYYTHALDILDTDGAVDMDEREAQWRSSGWNNTTTRVTGTSDKAAATTDMKLASVSTAPPSAARPVAASAPVTTAKASSATAAAVDTLQAGRNEVIPIYEETAQVAKRDVNHGRVRLRSYVVETPISEEVNLRNEQVQVERRPVDRPVSAADVAFKDRVIEAEEHTEEAFITKETRVKEEISLRKTVENQSQTVVDKVRRTEVEVEDTRAGRALAGTSGFSAATDASRIAEHMDVIASDGMKIGTVDHLDGPDKIKLAKTTSPDGQHHYIPLAWIDHVDTHVHLNKTTVAAKAGW